MDTSKSQWHNYAPVNGVKSANRLLYGKYSYSLVFTAKNSFYFRSAKGKTYEEFSRKIYSSYAMRNLFSEFSGETKEYRPLPAELNHLYVWMFYLTTKKIRYRVEYNTITLYAETENEAVEMLEYVKENVPEAKLHKLVVPPDGITLTPSTMAVRNLTEFKYMVLIKSSLCPLPVKQQFLTLLDANSDSIRISKLVLNRLKAEHRTYISGAYYVKDDSILSLIRLIAPKFVGKVYTLVEMKNS